MGCHVEDIHLFMIERKELLNSPLLHWHLTQRAIFWMIKRKIAHVHFIKLSKIWDRSPGNEFIEACLES